MWFTKRSFENTNIQHAVHFREFIIHSCLRDLRGEASLENIANGIGQCIHLRKLDNSFLKCLRYVSFIKDMLPLEELHVDQCQNISPDSALQGLQGHPNLPNSQWTCAFSLTCQSQQLYASTKMFLSREMFSNLSCDWQKDAWTKQRFKSACL